MIKRICLLLMANVLLHQAKAQQEILATIGKEKVLADEFLWAFNKNNRSDKPEKEALREYLDLHINYRLKVQEAYRLKYDTAADKRAEYKNLYKQMAEKQFHDLAMYEKLTKEAFGRLQLIKEVSSVFIAVNNFNNPAEVAKQYAKAQEAQAAINSGTLIEDVVAKYSNEDNVASTKGYLGYITAMMLPYEIETAIYNAQQGKASEIVQSKTGFYIFKVHVTKTRLGSIKARHILFSTQKQDSKAAKIKADQVYALLQKQPNWFDSLANLHSEDQLSNTQGGNLPSFRIGTYDAQFEKRFIQAVPKQLIPVFESSAGYHIGILDEIAAVSYEYNDAFKDSMKQVILNDRRAKLAQDVHMFSMLSKLGYKVNKAADSATIIQMANNMMMNESPFLTLPNKADSSTVAFEFIKQKITLGDWTRFFNAYKKTSFFKKQAYYDIYKEFIATTAYEYYINNYADYNKEFDYLMREFKDGSLYFDFMTNKVWNAASNDDKALKAYYNINKSKYKWKPSVSAIVVNANSLAKANEVYEKLVVSSKNWQQYNTPNDETIRIDSARYEYEILSTVANIRNMKVGDISKPEKINEEGWYNVAITTKVYDKEEVKNYNDAKGFLANDYQQVLDKKITNALKRKYPVVINKKEWDAIMK
jgi:peptidyl-prolyl cis-trans isomerase SurA